MWRKNPFNLWSSYLLFLSETFKAVLAVLNEHNLMTVSIAKCILTKAILAYYAQDDFFFVPTGSLVGQLTERMKTSLVRSSLVILPWFEGKN
jgi:hypothetical protein